MEIIVCIGSNCVRAGWFAGYAECKKKGSRLDLILLLLCVYVQGKKRLDHVGLRKKSIELCFRVVHGHQGEEQRIWTSTD